MLSLRKGSRKETCPSCGQRTFTPYVDEFGMALGAHVGRCDRQNKCCYHFTPREFYEERRKFNRLTGAGKFDAKRFIAPRPVEIVPTFIDAADFKATLGSYHLNPLARFLMLKFHNILPKERILATYWRMGFGTSRTFGGSAIFWQIDPQGHVRDGKIMGYDSNTGKRIKKPHPLISNVHTALKFKYKGEFKSCFFGSHLLAEDKANKPVLLFESEKAALIIALLYEAEGMWPGLPMATGGCGNLNPTAPNLADRWHALQVLKGRDVIFFPDQGMYDDWEAKARKLQGFCRSCYVATIMERHLRRCFIKCNEKEGDGLDDYILRYIDAGHDYGHLLNDWL